MRRLLPALGAAAVLVGVPLAVVSWEARRRGLVAVELLREAVGVDTGPAAPVFSPARRGPASDLLVPRSIGRPVTEPPRIGSVSVADLDRDGLLDVLACDMLEHRIAWLRQTAPGRFEERPVGGEVRAPARVAVADLDGDGDSDLAVAAMGKLFPTNEKIGSVVVLENDGTQAFSRRVLLEGVARVTDVRAGDLDGDGDLDLVVGQFGYDDGEIRWLENEGTRWDSHRLFGLSGTVHAIPADLDGDGDLDIAALVSQEWEETWVFENTGAGAFSPHLVYGSTNDDFGSSGIDLVDLDADGDLDVLYSNGDAFDYSPPRPKPWHGVQWLESLGGWRFAFRRIGDFCGSSA